MGSRVWASSPEIRNRQPGSEFQIVSAERSSALLVNASVPLPGINRSKSNSHGKSMAINLRLSLTLSPASLCVFSPVSLTLFSLCLSLLTTALAGNEVQSQGTHTHTHTHTHTLKSRCYKLLFAQEAPKKQIPLLPS